MNKISKLNEIINKDSAAESKKVMNKKKILNYLFYEEEKSIAELSSTLFISIPTITAYIEELVAENWVKGREISTGKQGRNPTFYSINPESSFTLIVDITTHSTKIFLLNLKNEIVESREYSMGLKNDKSYTKELLTIIDEAINEFNQKRKNIVAVGVTSPGLIDLETGQNKTYPALNNGHQGVARVIAKNRGIPAFILNDSKAIGLGEAIYGMGKKVNPLLSINVDWGVGLAVVINGELLNGNFGFAGELGHIQVNPNGSLCSCGKIGCLDTVASASSLLSKIRKDLEEGVQSSLSNYQNNPQQIQLETVVEAAHNGDGYAIDAIYNIGVELGKGLSIAVHLFNPQFIVINGVLANAGNLIVNPIEFAINKYCLPDFKDNLVVKVSDIGGSAKLMGMNAFISNHIFQHE